jgi:hypothetical protein
MDESGFDSNKLGDENVLSIAVARRGGTGSRKDCVIRACGEIVDVLWKRNQTLAAIN